MRIILVVVCFQLVWMSWRLVLWRKSWTIVNVASEFFLWIYRGKLYTRVTSWVTSWMYSFLHWTQSGRCQSICSPILVPNKVHFRFVRMGLNCRLYEIYWTWRLWLFNQDISVCMNEYYVKKNVTCTLCHLWIKY